MEDAIFAVRFAGYQVDGPERAQRALAALTDTERRFVEDVEADRIADQGCMQEIIEHCFGPYEPRR